MLEPGWKSNISICESKMVTFLHNFFSCSSLPPAKFTKSKEILQSNLYTFCCRVLLITNITFPRKGLFSLTIHCYSDSICFITKLGSSNNTATEIHSERRYSSCVLNNRYWISILHTSAVINRCGSFNLCGVTRWTSCTFCSPFFNIVSSEWTFFTCVCLSIAIFSRVSAVCCKRLTSHTLNNVD